MIPKLRLDALTDGVFAVAMTLLVIDLRLPEGVHPQDGLELVRHLSALGNQALVYVISFYVLSLRWAGLVGSGARGERVSESYTRWALLNLLLTTFVPFATMVIGRYPGLAPAVWIYSGTIILMAITAMRMAALAEADPTVARKARVGLSMLILAAVVAIALSFVAPRQAMLGYLVNALDQPFRRLMQARAAKRAA